MKLARWLLLFTATLLYASATTTLARPIPGLEGQIAGYDLADGSAGDAPLADPVVVEPIRPLFPSDRATGSSIVRPEPCGAMSPFLFGLTFVSLGFLSGTTRRALRSLDGLIPDA